VSAHNIIYNGFLRLHEAGKPTEAIHLINWLVSQGLLDKIGGRSKIAQLIDRTVSSINVDHLARLVAEKYLSRSLITVGNEIMEMGYDDSKDIADRLNNAEQKLFAIADQRRKGAGLQLAGEIVAEVWQDLEAGVNPGIPTGFYDLDTLLGGLFPGSLYVIGAVSGCGKSALANQLAYQLSKSGLPGAIFSLEMPRKQVLNRFLALEAGVSVKRLKSRQISDFEWPKIAEAVNVISGINLHIDDTPGISATEIVAQCRRLKSQFKQLGCVVIDYLQLMVGEGNEGTRNLELAAISRRFKMMAVELDVPVIVLSQFNRNLETRSSKRPVLSDLKDTGALGQDADVVLGLYRDIIYNPDTPDRNIAEVIVLKHRDGETGTVKLLFDGEHIKFFNTPQ